MDTKSGHSNRGGTAPGVGSLGLISRLPHQTHHLFSFTFLMQKIKRLGVTWWSRKLWIQHCHCYRSAGCCGTGSVSGLGTLACHGHSQKKERMDQISQIDSIGPQGFMEELQEFYKLVFTFLCVYVIFFKKERKCCVHTNMGTSTKLNRVETSATEQLAFFRSQNKVSLAISLNDIQIYCKCD